MFCRGKPRCDFCSSTDHSTVYCPIRLETNAIATCANCQGLHLPSDRSFPEWARQKDLKKLMVINKITFKEAVSFKNNNVCTPAFSFADITSRPISIMPKDTNISIPIPSSKVSFPSNTGFPHLDYHPISRKSRSPIKKMFKRSLAILYLSGYNNLPYKCHFWDSADDLKI